MHPIQSLRIRTTKAARAVAEMRRRRTVRASLGSLNTPTASGVWGITVVRNEADVIGHAIDHLLNEGISHVLAVDHMSNDGTAQILAERGDGVTVVPYRHAAFYQGTIMTVLARHAARSGADWIVPFDADEIWWASDGTPLAEHLLSRADEVAQADRWNFLPAEGDSSDENPFRRLIHRDDKPDRLPKVAFRSDARITVREGNHGVRPARRTGSGLVIAHYPYRSREQFVRKILQGNAGLSASTLPDDVGTHWRKLGVFDSTQLGRIWDDLLVTHQLPDGWHRPDALVRDSEARSLRAARRPPQP